MPSRKSKPRIIVICTGNSCRSQMAEAWFSRLAPESVSVVSAGSNPTGYVHPMAIDVMGEAGVDIQGYESKSYARFLDREFDYVITVCDDASETCPIFPGHAERIHWPFDDPAKYIGSEEEVKEIFLKLRDLIRCKVEEFLEDSA